MRGLVPVATLVIGLALGIAASRLLGGGDEAPAAAPAPTAAGVERPAEPVAGAVTEPMPRLPTDAELDPERRHFSPAPEVLDEPRSADIEYPVAPKYAGERFSEVPHEVIGAWDESPETTSPGRRRGIVIVVDPKISDSELETLVRDVAARHSDAEILNVKVFDSARAAATPSSVDGGALAFEHLVAEVKRNDRVPSELLRVRGRALSP